MAQLSAHFVVQLDAPCLVAFPDGCDSAQGHFISGDFTNDIQLIFSKGWYSTDDSHERLTSVAALKVVVTRQEDESIPEISSLPGGGRDLSVQQNYLLNRHRCYQDAARETVFRVLRYFRYKLQSPIGHLLTHGGIDVGVPEWFDEDGVKLARTNVCVVPGHEVAYERLGTKPLTLDLLPDFFGFLSEPAEESLVDAFLADAQTAWFEGGLRRAVLEMAIGVEIAIKRKFFAQKTPAGAAFDYLEDRARVSIKVLDLLDPIAREAFGASFREDRPKDFESIDHLFRCRNKVAHRGVLLYKDDGGKLIEVDAAKIGVWWISIVELRTWLNNSLEAIQK